MGNYYKIYILGSSQIRPHLTTGVISEKNKTWGRSGAGLRHIPARLDDGVSQTVTRVYGWTGLPL